MSTRKHVVSRRVTQGGEGMRKRVWLPTASHFLPLLDAYKLCRFALLNSFCIRFDNPTDTSTSCGIYVCGETYLVCTMKKCLLEDMKNYCVILNGNGEKSLNCERRCCHLFSHVDSGINITFTKEGWYLSCYEHEKLDDFSSSESESSSRSERLVAVGSSNYIGIQLRTARKTTPYNL